jgi:phospholipid/cholesterol/gamma-HCH transport system substrate-binding protein
VNVKKEVKVGILVVAALLVLYFGIDFLKGSDVFNPAKTYYAHYSNVDGLTASNPIMLNGFQVGLVKKIRIVQGSEKPVLVELEINKSINVGRNGKALLSNNGLLGGKMIVLDPGTGEVLTEGDTLIGSVIPGFTSMLEDKAQPMVNQVTHLVKTVDTLVASFHPTAAKLGETLESVRKLSDASTNLVSDSRSEVHEIAQNLQKLSASLLEAEKQLQQLLAKTDKITDSLNKADIAGAVHSLHKSADQLNQTLSSINQGKGSLGKLVKSDSLYKNLNASSASLNSLLIDVKANPKRYVHFSLFGGKDKKQKSGAAPVK